jgi:hypothetical protein
VGIYIYICKGKEETAGIRGGVRMLYCLEEGWEGQCALCMHVDISVASLGMADRPSSET